MVFNRVRIGLNGLLENCGLLLGSKPIRVELWAFFGSSLGIFFYEKILGLTHHLENFEDIIITFRRQITGREDNT